MSVEGSNPFARSIFSSLLVLRTFAMGRHFDELRIELTQDRYEVLLGGHDFVDVLINHWHFIQSCRDERDAFLVTSA